MRALWSIVEPCVSLLRYDSSTVPTKPVPAEENGEYMEMQYDDANGYMDMPPEPGAYTCMTL